ncbi:MAG: dihydroorotase family protein [Patescibacteria group bacterium]
MNSSIFIRGGTIVRGSGPEEADVLIEDGVIRSIFERANQQTSKPMYPRDTSEVIDAYGELIFPGLIDCHVHFREPGMTHKGDMRSESSSALAGGVTTVCEMPNTVPPTVTVEAFADKVRRAHTIKDCDMRLFFGITEHRHLIALRSIWIQNNHELKRLKESCVGVKVYLDHSTGNQKASEEVLEETFQLCAELGITVVAHCEDAEINKTLWGRNVPAPQGLPLVAVHSLKRPPASERKAIMFAIGLARRYGTKFHVAHLSTAVGLDLVREAKSDGLPVTCEVAPHHLFLTVEDYKTLGTLGKMNPPLRDKEDQEALWGGIVDGTVDCIATDHAPHTLEEKQNPDPLKAPSGVPGVETMLPLLLSIVHGQWPHPHLKTVSYKLKTQDIVRLCFDNPNRIFHLGKEGIREGAKADLVIVDPVREWSIHGRDLHARCGWTPYEGWKVRGAIKKVIWNGM